LAEILDQLPLSPLIREALSSGGTSKPAKIVETVRHQNRGDLALLASAGFSAQAVFMAWYEAVRWSDDIIRRM
jgi:hypothetical protein